MTSESQWAPTITREKAIMEIKQNIKYLTKWNLFPIARRLHQIPKNKMEAAWPLGYERD